MSNTKKLPPLPQKKKFSVVFQEDMENEDITEQENEKENNEVENTQTKINTAKPPSPIVINIKPENHNYFVSEIKTKIKKGFHIKYITNNTKLLIHDMTEWREFKDEIEMENIPFYTYTPKQDREHSFIIRGLDNTPTEEELIQILKEENNIDITKCF